MKKLLVAMVLFFGLGVEAKAQQPCPTGKVCSGSVTFTVSLPAPTTPAAVSPASVVAGAPATTITLTAVSGATFNNQMVVEACQLTPTVCTAATDLTTTFVDSGHLSAVIPVSMLASSGTIAIYISQPVNAHSVSLNWNESGTVAGYNLYRSTVSGSGYVKINSTLITKMSAIDATVQNGKTYFYVATAVDANGNESPFSNEASAVIPQN